MRKQYNNTPRRLGIIEEEVKTHVLHSTPVEDGLCIFGRILLLSGVKFGEKQIILRKAL